jgi:hypothetical protein
MIPETALQGDLLERVRLNNRQKCIVAIILISVILQRPMGNEKSCLKPNYNFISRQVTVFLVETGVIGQYHVIIFLDLC